MSLQTTYLPRTSPPALFLWEPPGSTSPGRTSPLTYGRGELALLPQATRDLLKLTVQQLELPETGTTTITGFLLPMPEGIAGLIAREEWHAGPVPLHPSLSFQCWSLAARFLLELLARQRIVPTVADDGVSRWRVILTAPEDRRRAEALARALPPVAYAGTGLTPAAALMLFLDLTGDAIARLPRQPTLPALRLRTNWEEHLFKALVGPFPRVRMQPFALANLSRQMGVWAQGVLGREGEESWVVCLKLVPPPTDGQPWRLEYLLQSVEDTRQTVPLTEVWSGAAASGGRRLPGRDVILTRLSEVSGLVPAVAASLAEPNPGGADLTDTEAWKFLTETSEVLAGSAVSVMVPRELVRAGRQRLHARLVLGRGGSGGGSAEPGTGTFRLDQLVEFSYQVALGDEVLSAEQFREVAALKRPLVRWRDQWIALDPREQATLEELLSRRSDGTVTGIEALRLALAGKSGRGHSAVEVMAVGALAAFMDRLRSTEVDRDPPAPATFRGHLRPYQARGMAWMGLLTDLGLGALLADDMGLGKTIELIAWLLTRREKLDRPVLLVCPTSVLGNWQREIERFAPTLKVVRHHGPLRAKSAGALGVGSGDVLLTTYALVRRDIEMLDGMEFSALILDEAHALKNPRSQQALAVQRILAPARIALTGTPIENRLTDLWSIMQVLNPGLLGSYSVFQHDLALPVERYADEEAAAELKRLTAPFVLRRVKSDPMVLSDLPEKNEMRVHCPLTAEQAALYQAVLDEHLAEITGSTGMERRGRVLALITRLKQVLNHPAHYLRQKTPLTGRSGKLERLEEMIAEVVAAEDRALVFTQYREMGELLAARIAEVIGEPVPFLHGGVPATGRDAMVQKFQEDPEGPHVFVLSLRAGGTGLNLMRANHVFHFDRWWNPAVEDQATDRAFRIGQKRSVQVHKMVTLGTLEEKIDRLLETKRKLASSIVGTGETWITELDDDELGKLLALSDTVVEDPDAMEEL